MRQYLGRRNLAYAVFLVLVFLLGAWLEVGDERFSSSEIERLYEASDYPLHKRE